MIKNLFILALFSWMSLTHAYVAKESMSEAEGFQLQKADSEPEAQRAVAGSKIKRQRLNRIETPPNPEGPAPSDSSAIVEPSESSENSENSEVRYWQYSE